MAELKTGDQYCKLFVGGLSPQTNEENLRSYFEQYGPVSDVVVMKDNNTGKPRGFGFVTFESQEAVDNVQASRPHTIDGKQADTKRAIPKDDPAPENRFVSKQIFVGGLKREITKEQVEEYFKNYGSVSEVVIVKDKVTQQSRGYGFITFEDSDTVDKIIINKPHEICTSRADVKKALSKEEMAQIPGKQPQAGGNQQGMGGNQGYANNQGWGMAQGYGQANMGYGAQQGYGYDPYGAASYGQGYTGGYGADGYGMGDANVGYDTSYGASGWGAPSTGYQAAQSNGTSNGNSNGNRGGRGGRGAARGNSRGGSNQRGNSSSAGGPMRGGGRGRGRGQAVAPY